MFDSSRDRGRPFTFELAKDTVIKCWEEGFAMLLRHQRAVFRCPPEYAYGSAGAGTIIPPHSVLLFNVELLEINPTQKETSQ